MKLRALQQATWVVFDEVGGPIDFYTNQDEAHARAKERGASRLIVYVAQVAVTNDSAQWRR